MVIVDGKWARRLAFELDCGCPGEGLERLILAIPSDATWCLPPVNLRLMREAKRASQRRMTRTGKIVRAGQACFAPFGHTGEVVKW